MADIVEYLYQTATVVADNKIDWILQDDSVTPGTFVATTMDPTKVILKLVSASGTTITIDSSVIGYDLGGPGDGTTFEWNTATSGLTIYLGGEAISGFPVGSYLATLLLFDATYTNGLRWGHQTVYFVIR